jgi:tetratricopeptide (TPR) repeat protein
MLEHQTFRDPAPDEPRVLVVFSFRHDAHLVPDLLENIRPGVHGYVAWDDRQADRAMSDEPARRVMLARTARDHGADWLLAADPDERFEAGIADWLPALLAHGDHILWHFQVREMFSPTQFRVDGLWASKPRLKLFPARNVLVDPTVELHGSWVSDETGLLHRASGLNLYHLRMATPERRQLRRDLYAAADPERRFQPIGYDYLTDERGMVLESVPEGRGFTPAFVEDHGLWSPDPGDLGEVSPDPYAVRFARAAASARHLGQRSAQHVMEDLTRESPQDDDLRHLAGRFSLLGRDHAGAADIAQGILRDRPDDLSARLLHAEALVALGLDPKEDLASLARAVPDSPVLDALCADARRPAADFSAPDADWRHVAPPDATLAEGEHVAAAALAVVVIGFRCQPGLLAAVRSLLDQDTACEIVVVNTGGGDVAHLLAPVLDHIRLIASNRPCFVGAARNIGVRASRARFVAFLAGDCRARPGWVSGRLRHHLSGALSVSSAVIADDFAGLPALAANRLRYAARHPLVPLPSVSHYGQSYDRQLLHRCGAFPPDLPSAEDTRLNRIARHFAQPVWAPEVQTIHAEPPSLLAWLQDESLRGRKQAIHAPFRALAVDDMAPKDLHRRLDALSAFRLRLSRRIVSNDHDLSAAECRAILAMQGLAAMSARRGILAGLADIASANRLTARAEAAIDRPDQALVLVEAARRLDPHNPEKTVLEGRILMSLGRTSEAETAFRNALGLAPSNRDAAELLTGLVAARDGADRALQCAERIALAAPTAAALWSNAARQASAAGRTDWAVALGRVALACAVDRPGLHADLARHHVAAEDQVLAAFRAMTARRLAAERRIQAGNAPPLPG